MKNFLLLRISFMVFVLIHACKEDSPTKPKTEEKDNWFELSPLDNAVGAMTIFNGNLIVGGNFTKAGDVSMNHIAEWDGSNWNDLSGGVSDGAQNVTTIYALTVFNNRLIVAGRFSRAGNMSVNNIAAWDGSTWSALGEGIDADALNRGPLSLTVYQGNLIVGGNFDEAGGVIAEDLAYWDGSEYGEFAGGTSGGFLGGGVQALLVFDNNLVAAGSFSQADSTTVSNIALWNGTSWSSLNSGINSDGRIYDLAVYNNNLIAGGNFSQAGEIDAEDIAVWNKSNWSACGTGITEGSGIAIRIEALSVYNGQLIAGGMFSKAGDVPASNIARWDGSTWSALGKGVDEGLFGLTFVTALQVFDGKLFVGGSFTTAGEKTVGHIAGWEE